jgi:DNA-binding transcriptional ArsR family regulator
MLNTTRLDAAFFALSDPTRRAILTRLAAGEATVGELTEPSGLTQPAISRHLRVLERAGLIQRGRSAQRRPARLVEQSMSDVLSWIDLYRKQWERAYDRLDAVLAEERKRT